ncbi:cytochrome c biogenesis protein CcsA [Adhaeribacter pallidiroseus]|uniref:Heme exporter protein n=1 Tax=Adhaeribacter pallidiroseus TaxID=2072847 RepID=A0A369QSZ9_9BACT|nr:cytochrome c biogenesis protein CcsA [Adhaeribacter pallidiroseus]RDC65288.1 Heme exporter protein [Adhaeribacter pallidiroseus]
MKLTWWKVLTVVLLLYTIVAGLLNKVPHLAILNETIRNIYFHVPMWFGMIIILTVSVIYSIKYLRKPSVENDIIAESAAKVGVLLGVLGIITGMEWARFTWGEYWSNDPKQNASAIGLLIYFAYLVLRSSFAEQQQRARISAVYNIFAFAALIPLLFILPRLTDSLHPGNGGNPGFSSYDLDNNMRMVFYPAVIAWTLLGVWMVNVKSRLELLQYKLHEQHA